MLQAVGPTIPPALFDRIKGGYAHASIIDILYYLELHHCSLSSQDIIFNIYNSDVSMPAKIVTWDHVYAT